jgi:NAD(P)-dependent dehydrogenase (short-subunit alcohol dehydrogenase family)
VSVRPLSEQVVVVTGATAGLGRYVVGELASTGATVVVHGRDPATVDRVPAETEQQPRHGRVETAVADLADLRQVDRLADDLLDRLPRLDVLLNNAGVGFGPPGGTRQLSADGLELRFAVNYLAGYHLTRRLLPLLRASAPARIVNVSSVGQEPIDFSDPMLDTDYTGMVAYRRSKLAQITWTFDLAEELRDTGVTVNALHPATLMDTPMVEEMAMPPRSTVEEGAAATLRLVTAEELTGVTGRYFDGMVESRAHDQAYDDAARARLRALSDELVASALGSDGST